MLVEANEFKQKFEKIINSYEEFAIVPHFNPDPDALAGSFAMHYLLSKVFEKKSKIYFSGIIGRAENNKMIQLLDIPITLIKDNILLHDFPIILIDTQPGTGNNPLKSIKNLKIVIDHHPVQEKISGIPYADIRTSYGSSSSIMYDYYKQYNLKPIVNIATALFYGIQTDVVGEGRMGYKIDFDSMEDLTQYINREKLFAIENPKLPFDYYIHINKGMENTVVYNDFLISSLGELENPDYIGEIADFLIRFDKAAMVLVMGVYQDTIQISFRSQGKRVNAGMIIKAIVGRLGSAGGHFTSAGGRITIQDPEDVPRINKKLITRALHILQGKITTGVPFLSLTDYLNY